MFLGSIEGAVGWALRVDSGTEGENPERQQDATKALHAGGDRTRSNGLRQTHKAKYTTFDVKHERKVASDGDKRAKQNLLRRAWHPRSRLSQRAGPFARLDSFTFTQACAN